MTFAYALIGILGLAVLMVVHEGGHYLAARRFGMRVTKFSIGFGPTIYKRQPKGSPTTYQIALIPFLAYVQIAGLNPYEEIDPKDPESYANASLLGRIVTIAAGPLANYVFASIFIFFGLVIGGTYVVDETSLRVEVLAEGPAAAAGMQRGDRVLSVNGESVTTWERLAKIVGSHPGEAIDLEIERGSERLHLHPTPSGTPGEARGKIMIGPYRSWKAVTVPEAAALSATEPAKIVYGSLRGIVRMIGGQEKPDIAGPVPIVKEMAAAAKRGVHDYLKLLGILSASVGVFNLLPLPALDGGRLIFLFFEAASRRRADAKTEAKVHAVGILMFLTLMAVVTYIDVFKR